MIDSKIRPVEPIVLQPNLAKNAKPYEHISAEPTHGGQVHKWTPLISIKA